MKAVFIILTLLWTLPIQASTFCNFTPPRSAALNVIQAFAAASKYYAQAPDVDMIFYGCRNAETVTKDTTYGLLEKNGLPAERIPGVTYLFVFFTEFKDGAYQFSLDETDDPWMDGYATVHADTGAIAPRYDWNVNDAR